VLAGRSCRLAFPSCALALQGACITTYRWSSNFPFDLRNGLDAGHGQHVVRRSHCEGREGLPGAVLSWGRPIRLHCRVLRSRRQGRRREHLTTSRLWRPVSYSFFAVFGVEALPADAPVIPGGRRWFDSTTTPLPARSNPHS